MAVYWTVAWLLPAWRPRRLAAGALWLFWRPVLNPASDGTSMQHQVKNWYLADQLTYMGIAANVDHGQKASAYRHRLLHISLLLCDTYFKKRPKRIHSELKLVPLLNMSTADSLAHCDTDSSRQIVNGLILWPLLFAYKWYYCRRARYSLFRTKLLLITSSLLALLFINDGSRI